MPARTSALIAFTYSSGVWVGLCLGAGAVLAWLTYLFAWVRAYYGGAISEDKKKPRKKKSPHPVVEKRGGPPAMLYAVWCTEHRNFIEGRLLVRIPDQEDYTCPVTIIGYAASTFRVPDHWLHTICLLCWNERRPDERPVRPDLATLKTCCFCGKPTPDGIPITSDPRELDCKHGAAG